MIDQCRGAVAQAVGRELTDAEYREIETRITRHMRQNAARDPQTAMAMSKSERMTEAAKTAAEELVAEQAKKAQRQAQQILAASRTQAFLETAPDKFAALRRMVAFHGDQKADVMSMESWGRGIRNEALGSIIDTLQATHPKFLGLFENEEGVRALVRELHGEDSGVPEAKAGAKLYREKAEQMRERFNRSGGDIGKLEDWGMPHHHSQGRVAAAGRDAWVDATLPLLNRARYVNPDGSRMADAQLREFLGEAWTTIATGGANKVQPGQFRGSGSVATRGADAHRSIHFRDADAFIAYQQQFGERALYDVLTGHIEGMARNIAAVETFGPNPDATMRLLLDTVEKDATLADPKRLGKFRKERIAAERLYDETAGHTEPIASKALADTFDTLRSWMAATRLGSAVITSFSDEATMRLAARTLGLPQMRLFANELAALNPANPTEKRLAMRAGLGLNTMLASLNRWGSDTLSSGVGQGITGTAAAGAHRVAGAVLRASGLNALTEARKRAFGATMMDAIGNVVHENARLADLDATDAKLLKSKGVTETDFAVWKAATPEDWGNGNSRVLTAESIYQTPDAAVAKAIGDDSPAAIQVAREQAATRLLGAVLEEVDVAVIEPGARERALMHMGTQRGTWKGELTRSVFQFKAFPIAMITRHWSRAMAEDSVAGRAGYLAMLIASTTLLGALSMEVNEVLNGRDPRQLIGGDHPTRNWFQAMLKGGSLGLYGDFLFSESTQTGRGVVASALGPTIGLAEEVMALTQGNLVQWAQGKKTNAGGEAVKFVRGMTPGSTLWYLKGGLDRMIWHQLAEYLSPGYLSSMQSRQMREFGTTYWAAPGDITPDRGPKLERIVSR